MTADPMLHPAAIAAALVVGALMVGWRALHDRSWVRSLAWGRRLLILVMCAVVLARPSVPGTASTVVSTDADVLLVVDTTASVSAEDWGEAQTRLSGIQADLETLIGELSGARFVLITFDRSATVRVPATTDAAAVLTAVSLLRPEVSQRARGSSVGIAASLVQEQIEDLVEENPMRSRAVYYFGDGEQTVATSPESFAGSAGYLVGGAVLGYGTEAGGPMRQSTGDGVDASAYIMNPATGEVALSTTQPDTLARIATELGVPLTLRDAGTALTVGELRLAAPSLDGTTDEESVTELYWVAALVLVPLLVLELGAVLVALVRSRRGRVLR